MRKESHNVHTAKDGDFSQAEQITHTGALLVGTYDNFTDGDPSEFLRNLNSHMPTAKENRMIFIEKTGHTYQMKNQEVADDILHQLQEWLTPRSRLALFLYAPKTCQPCGFRGFAIP